MPREKLFVRGRRAEKAIGTPDPRVGRSKEEEEEEEETNPNALPVWVMPVFGDEGDGDGGVGRLGLEAADVELFDMMIIGARGGWGYLSC